MISRPEQDGDQQLRLLGDAWDQAAEHWRDGPARQFGDGSLAPVLQESRSYLEALRKLMDTLEAADRETEGLAAYSSCPRSRRIRARMSSRMATAGWSGP
jgi:hypothetical protein